MFHRLWTLIRKELQSLLREPQTRAILILPVLIQVILFPFAATLEVTNATIAIYDEDNGEHSVELTQRFARASAFTHVLLLKSPQEIRPTIDTQKALLLVRFPADFSRKLDTFQTAPLQLIPSRFFSRTSILLLGSCWTDRRLDKRWQCYRDLQRQRAQLDKMASSASWWRKSSPPYDRQRRQ